MVVDFFTATFDGVNYWKMETYHGNTSNDFHTEKKILQNRFASYGSTEALWSSKKIKNQYN